MRNRSAVAAPLLVVLALLAPAAAEDPPAKKAPPFVLRIEGTPLTAKFDLPGFVVNEQTLSKLRAERGNKVLAAGSGIDGVLVDVLAEKESGDPLSSAAWRKKLKPEADEYLFFQAGEVECYDDSKDVGGTQHADYHAYVVAGGSCFDLHATQMGNSEDPGFFTKGRFRDLVASFRVGAWHRGSFADHAAEVVDLWHSVAAKHPAWKAAADAAVAAKPEDWVPAFVAWEASCAFGAPAAESAAAGAKAADLLAKANPAEPAARFAWASVEEALGLAEHAAGKFKAAVARLRRAADLAPTSSPAVRGAIHFNLARAQAKAAVAKDAIAALTTAIECDGSLREAATEESDFSMLRSRPEWKALVTAPKK